MPWNSSGTFAVRLSVETLTANREILWPDFDGTFAVGAGIGSGVSVLTLHRTDMTAEGGQLSFNRAADDGLAWAIDVFGSGSSATALRFIDAKAGTVPMLIDQSAQSVFVNKLNVSATAVHSGFTQLGDVSPNIKMKKLTGVTPAVEGTFGDVTHNLDYTKILDLGMFIISTSNERIMPGYLGNPGFEYYPFLTSSTVRFLLKSANSASVLSRSYTILLTYDV